MTNKIAIIIPAYNEGKNIVDLVNQINNKLSNCHIYIVDDSTVNSYDLLSEKKNLEYFHRGKKLGRGSAVIFGLNNALKLDKYNLFIEMDADFSHDPNELIEKVNYFNNHSLDLLVSSRYLNDSKIINWSSKRLIFSKLSNFLAKKLLNINVTDYTNGYRFYSERAAKKIVKHCGKIGDGFIVLSEILVVISNNKFKIGETPTVFINRARGESSVNFKLIIQSLFGIIKLFFLKKNNHGV